MPEQLLEIEGAGAGGPARELDPVRIERVPGPAVQRRARDELRRQIALLERRLWELFASAFPRAGIDWGVPAVGGPRVLGVAELERVRDGLAARLREAEAELARRGEIEEANRVLLESMVAAPERYRWVRVAAEDIGERPCQHWHSRPRWGILGMLFGWWRVKHSSGCPLAAGLAAPAPAVIDDTSRPRALELPHREPGRTSASSVARPTLRARSLRRAPRVPGSAWFRGR